MQRHALRFFAARGLIAASLTLASSGVAGCDRCNSEPRVPFKLGDELDGSSEQDAALKDESQTFVEAVNEPIVDGAKVPIAFVRAMLTHDLDGDGDRDVLALVHDTARRMRLLFSVRDGAGFEGGVDITGFAAPGDDTCTIERAELLPVGSDKAALQIAQRCGDPQVSQPASHTLLSLEQPPRLLERFELLASEQASAFTLHTTGTDTDGDGHADVVLEIADANDPTRNLKLAWLDRASGLSRDASEPDKTLQAWAGAAQGLLAKQPEQALALADQVLRLDRALCREAGAPELMVSGSPGLLCGARKGANSALTSAALAHAKLKHVRAAFDAYTTLTRAEAKLQPKALDKLQSALAGLSSKGLTLREGPRVEPARSPRVRLPSARFVDDDTLLLRRHDPVLYSLTTGEETSVPMPVDELVRDPSGGLCVTDVEQSACGLSLRVERAPKVGAPFVATAPVATPLLRALIPGSTCAARGAVRSESGGYRVLGWAPQGVVAARGVELVVVPLDLNGAPSGPPFVLPPGVPPPAPLPLGIASTDGARYVELTPVGPLVTERGRDAPELWRPEGYGPLAANAREAAISPSGKRVAVLVGEVVYVISRESGR